MERRKMKIGTVVSNAMEKTVAVLVERTALHPTYKKYVRRRKKFLAHDEKNACKVGDKVEIIESRPLSRRKRWRVARVLERGEGALAPVAGGV